jgi:hypothetical protein
LYLCISHGLLTLTRMELGNAQDLELRIGERGRWMNSKVWIETNKVKLDVY